MSFAFKYIVLTIMLFSEAINAQIQRTDTILFNDTIKQISLLTNKGSYIKHICGSDTSLRKDNSIYYQYIIDSLRNTKEYLTRERIANGIEMLYIDIDWNTRGSWSATSFHIYMYYNQKIKKHPKGLVFYNDLHNKRKLIGLFNDEIFISILKILDDNMALNHKTDQQYLIEDISIVGSGTRELKLKLKKNNNLYENNFLVDNCSYGFGKTSFYEIMRLGLKLATKDDETLYYNYVQKNEKVLSYDKYFSEIIDQFENN